MKWLALEQTLRRKKIRAKTSLFFASRFFPFALVLMNLLIFPWSNWVIAWHCYGKTNRAWAFQRTKQTNYSDTWICGVAIKTINNTFHFENCMPRASLHQTNLAAEQSDRICWQRGDVYAVDVAGFSLDFQVHTKTIDLFSLRRAHSNHMPNSLCLI